MTTRRHAAVLGSPITHSLSPVLHRTAYRELGLDDWTYDSHDVDESALESFLGSLDDSWAGLSLTMPLKRAVLPLLDSVTDTVRSVQAVNTVLRTADGRKEGDNTDIPGMTSALRERGITHAGHAAVLGAGATAASALAALARMGTRDVTAYVRSEARAAEMGRWGERLGLTVRTVAWHRAAHALNAPLVISTTPARATDALADSVPDKPGVLFDVLYSPWPTRLAHHWQSRGGTVVGGLDLLVHQAVLQVEMMTGRRPAPVHAMRAAAERALDARTQLV
ncbi:shikimate dehydrogenase [Streptomyces sp. SA15]|uniref:shikimate dehydrogenase n=1 Tax=Streptomyces sp. SA15 TaxID=934019 RepID=UPI000BAF22FF|nr:shikimate dehydrogenase [Streptomyces sp. SA15]PAZ15866.1 shikimate dehydrogenase [Streptomyces sp. SA15]